MVGASFGSHTASTGGPVSDWKGVSLSRALATCRSQSAAVIAPRAGVVTANHPVGDRDPWPVEVATVGEARTAHAKGVDERECRGRRIT
jgi:hypothetical protein